MHLVYTAESLVAQQRHVDPAAESPTDGVLRRTVMVTGQRSVRKKSTARPHTGSEWLSEYTGSGKRVEPTGRGNGELMGGEKAVYSTGMCCTNPGELIQPLTPSAKAWPLATMDGSRFISVCFITASSAAS